MKKKIGIIISIVIVCFVGIVLFKTKDSAHASKKIEPPLAIPAPVIMVPGTNGDVDRFDSLVNSLKETEKNVDEKKSRLTKMIPLHHLDNLRKRRNGQSSRLLSKTALTLLCLNKHGGFKRPWSMLRNIILSIPMTT